MADPVCNVVDGFGNLSLRMPTAAAVVDIIAAVDSAAWGNNCFRIWNGVGDGERRKKPFFVDEAEDVDDDVADGVVIICGVDKSARCIVSSIFHACRLSA